MKTPSFNILLSKMSPTQQSALEELERIHTDLVWDGGSPDALPFRVSVKNQIGKSMAAINTRQKEAFLRLEFRSRDYSGSNGVLLRHKNFDKGFDLIDSTSIPVAAEILSDIKKNYQTK